MNKLKTYARKIIPTVRTKKSNIIAPPVKVHDVTACLTDIDLSALDVIEWTPAHMSRAERLLLYTLTFTLRPTRYLEIGTLHGGSALIVTAAMNALNSSGKLVCVDPNPRISPEHWEKLKHRSTVVEGFSPDVLQKAQQIAGGPFDFVLIDGDHSYEGLMRDAVGVLPFVSNGAYILFHDSFFSEVRRGLDDFVKQHADQVVDFGAMTREITLHEAETKPVQWGGLRMVQVRRN
ncbi:MAG: class I SAM-dependent methyltransferase [Ardenticatenaceae bacterium]